MRASPLVEMPRIRHQPRFDDTAEAIGCVLRFPGQRLATFSYSFGAHAAALYQLAAHARHGRASYPAVEEPLRIRSGRAVRPAPDRK